VSAGARDPRSGDSAKQLEGFLQLLMSREAGLPEATPQILRYLEEIASREPIEPAAAQAAAARAYAEFLHRRLSETSISPVRPLGLHLLAKRNEAGVNLEDVASVLRQEPAAYANIEACRSNPLRLATSLLAHIVKFFGLTMQDLRQALLLSLEDLGRTAGESFARERRTRGASISHQVAAHDLLKASGRIRRVLSTEQVEQVETKVKEVFEQLQAEP
jgi:hypothetical protein